MGAISNTNTFTNEQQEAESLSWLSLIIKSLPHALVASDSGGIIRFVNEQFNELFGIKAPVNTHYGKHLNDVMKETGIQTIDNIISLPDGRFIKKEEILLQDGIGRIYLFKDETTQLTTEAELKQKRKFYEDVLNSIPSDIAVFSSDHKYLYINPVGLGDSEVRKWLIGKDDFDYCQFRGKDPSFAERRRNMFEKIIQSGKEIEWEERIINRQGEAEYHLRKLSPVYDEHKNFLWTIGYSVNITERKKIEEKIQVSEKKYRDLYNYSQAIICTHDLNGVFLSVNPSLLEVMGYNEEDVVGRNIKEFLAPDDQAAFNELYLKAIKTQTKVKGIFKVLHRNGSKVYLLYQNYRVAESPDEEAYIIAFAQDITDRIKVERELKAAKKITEETARNKERFLANMSHEIRTPMNGIIGITAFLQKTTLTEEQTRYLDIIQEAAHDLLTIINDILDLEKIGTGQIQLEKISFDIIGKTNTVISLFDITAKNKNVTLVFENKIGKKLAVNGDPTRFNQVLNNLISNAVKFTHNGTVTIKAEKEKEDAQYTWLKFSVIDTGIGIDKANIDKIFQPFTQAYPETTRMYGGTGLGLAITKNLVELQGGDIHVESRPREGSTFSFIIPFEKTTAAQQNLLESTLPVHNELGALRIIVAEDNEVNMVLTTGMLQHLGFIPLPARTGLEVMEIIRTEKVDLVLMDIQMPEMNGYDATKAIRLLPDEKSTIPVIALTANALKGEEDNYYNAGMNGYLTKPFTESAIYTAIENVIRNIDFKQPKKEAMSQNTEGEKLYDLTMVSELARGNKDFIANLAKIFVDTVPVTAKDMVEACEKQQWEAMGKHAHKLKSTIDTMSISALKDDIRAIEKNGKEQKNLDITPGLVQKADDIIRRVTEQLKAEFNL